MCFEYVTQTYLSAGLLDSYKSDGTRPNAFLLVSAQYCSSLYERFPLDIWANTTAMSLNPEILVLVFRLVIQSADCNSYSLLWRCSVSSWMQDCIQAIQVIYVHFRLYLALVGGKFVINTYISNPHHTVLWLPELYNDMFNEDGKKLNVQRWQIT